MAPEPAATIREAIRTVADGNDLTRAQATATMDAIMSGEATGAQIGCLLTALRLKKETVEEITGFATVMRDKVTRIAHSAPSVVDTCGTGGDGLHTFNISTIAAFVAAGAGAVVAKHGNRSVSSACGSADVLKALGVNIEAPVEIVERCLDEAGIGFLYAPLLHKAMKHAIGPRREIGIRTVFNILGPLTNPAGATAQLLGVYDGALTETLAHVLKELGSTRVFVVHGEDGEDEISITGPTRVSELRDGRVTTYAITPEQFDMQRASIDEIVGGDPEQNAGIAQNILEGWEGPHRNAVVLNAGAAIAAAGLADDIPAGITMAADAVDSRAAAAKLQALIKLTNA